MTAAWDREEALSVLDQLERVVIPSTADGLQDATPVIKAAALLRAADAEIARLRAREDAAAKVAEAPFTVRPVSPFGDMVDIPTIKGPLMLVSVIGLGGIQPRCFLLPHQLYAKRVRELEEEGTVVVCSAPAAGNHFDVSAAIAAWEASREGCV